MGSFLSSFKNSYILHVVDYVSKQVGAKVTRIDNAKVIIDFVKSYIFVRFGIQRAIISDRGTHFYNQIIETLFKKYHVTRRISTTYQPQTSEQVEVSNREMKSILGQTINSNRKDCGL